MAECHLLVVVLSCQIQITNEEILIFGGSDVHAEKSDESFIYNAKSRKMRKIKDEMEYEDSFPMRNPVNYGGIVFIFGCHTRNIYKYSIKNEAWIIKDDSL